MPDEIELVARQADHVAAGEPRTLEVKDDVPRSRRSNPAGMTPVIEIELVLAAAACQRVGAFLAFDLVISGAAGKVVAASPPNSSSLPASPNMLSSPSRPNRVRRRSAEQRVVTGVTVDVVIAGAAANGVVAVSAGKHGVVTVTAVDNIVPGIPVKEVAANAAVDRVGAPAAFNPVVTVTTVQRVAAVTALDHVIAAAAVDRVVAAHCQDRVVPRGAVDCVGSVSAGNNERGAAEVRLDEGVLPGQSHREILGVVGAVVVGVG